MNHWPGIVLGMVLSTAALAQAGPSSITDEEAPLGEPAVDIKPGEGGVTREFRVNGQLYMILVMPTKGRPYYLVDTDGDGSLDTRSNNLDPDGLLIPAWTLKRW